MSNFFQNHIVRKIVYLIALINLSLLFYYIFHTYKYYFTSDSASKVLFTAEAIKLGVLHPVDWNYVNNDVRVLAPHYFIAPFLFFLPPTYLTHALGGGLAALTILFSVWLSLGTTGIAYHKRFLVLIAVLAGISPINANNIYGEYVYGTDLAIACLIIFLSHSLLFEKKNNLIYGILLTSIFSLVFWSNPIRATASFFLPFLSGSLISLASDKLENPKNRVFKLVAFGTFGCVVGFALHAHTLNSINMIMSSANLKWTSFSSFFPNLLGVIENFFIILGGAPSNGVKVVSIKGVIQGIYLINALTFAGLLVFITFKQIQKFISRISFLGTFALTSFTCITFITITTGLTGHRYLNPSILLILIYVFSSNGEICSGKISSAAKKLSLILFILSAPTAYTVKNEVVKAQIGISWNTETAPLISFLEKNNLSFGYSTYWNASSITVLSQSKVTVRAIEIAHKIPKPYRWLSFDHWYTPINIENSFLLLNKNEVESIDWVYLKKIGVVPVNQLNFEQYLIYTFDVDLSTKLPDWNKSPS